MESVASRRRLTESSQLAETESRPENTPVGFWDVAHLIKPVINDPILLTTRRATDDDLAFLAELFLRAMRIHITEARGFWDEARERNQFLEQLQLHETQIIEYESEDIGFLTTIRRGHDMELQTLCIAPEYQRRGFGTVSTRRFLNDAKACECGAILSVLKANTAARSLYERLGFVVIEESAHHHLMRYSQ